MKKLYTLISLMLLFVGSAWGNILGDGKTVTLGEQVTSVSDITTGTYILANAKTKMYYSENAAGNAIVMSNDVTQYSAVYIKVTTNDNADPTCTIQAYSGNYYNDLTTSSQIKTSTSSGIFTILTPTKTSDLTDQGIWFKNGNNYINRSDDNTQGTGYTGTGAYSRQYVYKANIVDAIDVTYRVVNSENENDVWASEVITQADGAAVLDKKSDFTHDFVKLSDSESNPTTISAENNTVTYIGTSTTPFTASTSFDDATWYYIKGVQNGKYLYYSANSTSTPIDGTSQSITATEYHWAFLGNPIDGYQIINEAAGDGSYMYYNNPSSTGQTPYMQQTEQNPAWAIYNTAAYSSATSSQFSFGNNGYYWNDQNVNNARLLSFWNGNGVGNAFTAEKVPTYSDLVASNIKPVYDATTWPRLTSTAKTALESAGYSSDKTDGYTAEQYNNMLTVVQTASNYEFPESGYYRIKSSGTAQQGTVGYIGFGYTNYSYGSANRGVGLKTFTVKNDSASTVLYLERTADADAYKYTIKTQNQYATHAIRDNYPVLTTSESSNAGIFTFAPITNNTSYLGYCSIQANEKGNSTYAYFHEAGWGSNISCVCLWDAGAGNTPSFWQIEAVKIGEQVFSGSLHQVGTSSEYYATAYLPFPYTLSEGVTAYTATLDGEYLKLHEITTGVVPANTAVVLYSTTVSNFTCLLAEDATIDNGNDLKGYTIATTVSASENCLTLGQMEGTVGFYKWAGTLLNKAYLPYTDLTSTSSKGFAFSFGDDDDPTGISEDLIREAVKELQGQRYNVQGQPVGADYKGIVIQGGKKYLQK